MYCLFLISLSWPALDFFIADKIPHRNRPEEFRVNFNYSAFNRLIKQFPGSGTRICSTQQTEDSLSWLFAVHVAGIINKLDGPIIYRAS